MVVDECGGFVEDPGALGRAVTVVRGGAEVLGARWRVVVVGAAGTGFDEEPGGATVVNGATAVVDAAAIVSSGAATVTWAPGAAEPSPSAAASAEVTTAADGW